MRQFAVFAMLVIFLACGCSAQPESRKRDAKPGQGHPLLEDAGRNLARLHCDQARVLALCELAGKAAPINPEAASAIACKAFSLLPALYASEPLGLVRMLRQASRDRDAGGLAGPMKTAAGDLSRLIYSAWPLILLAEASLTLEPRAADIALSLAEALAKNNPHQQQREQDLGLLVHLTALRRASSARGLIGLIKSAYGRSAAYFRLFAVSNQSSDLAAAVLEARSIKDPLKQALQLARIGAGVFSRMPQQAELLLQEAFDAAARLERPDQRGWAMGEVAARAAQADAMLGWRLGRRTPTGDGASFKALSRAGASFFISRRDLGVAAEGEALKEAWLLGSDHQRQRALGRLASDLAPLFPGRAQAILQDIPRHKKLLHARPSAAMVLAEAADDYAHAEAMAHGISDQGTRIMAIARLAAIRAGTSPEEAERAFEGLLSQGGGWAGLLPASLLRVAWKVMSPGRAFDLAMMPENPGDRARALFSLAKVFAARGEKSAAGWCICWALDSISEMDGKQTLDKARLLGDMGQEWSAINKDQGQCFFFLAADACEDFS